MPFKSLDLALNTNPPVFKTRSVWLPLKSYQGENEGVLPNGADDEEDADEHELVQAGLHPPGRGPVEEVDADQEENHQQGHPARYYLGRGKILKKYSRQTSNLLKGQWWSWSRIERQTACMVCRPGDYNRL